MNRIDYSYMIGKRFYRLVVLEWLVDNDGPRNGRCKCQCDCGKIHITIPRLLNKGNVRSCGCRHRKHGNSYERIFQVWYSMLGRCYNPKNTSYVNYGARGLSVCEEWEDYFVFKKWALENGYVPGLHIDRRDNDKNYGPENCRFVTRKENNRNKRNNVFLTHQGLTLTIAEWSERTGISRQALEYRKQKGWPDEIALTKLVIQRKKKQPPPVIL